MGTVRTGLGENKTFFIITSLGGYVKSSICGVKAYVIVGDNK
jgi:hypothetical protein